MRILALAVIAIFSFGCSTLGPAFQAAMRGDLSAAAVIHLTAPSGEKAQTTMIKYGLQVSHHDRASVCLRHNAFDIIRAG